MAVELVMTLRASMVFWLVHCTRKPLTGSNWLLAVARVQLSDILPSDDVIKFKLTEAGCFNSAGSFTKTKKRDEVHCLVDLRWVDSDQ